MNSIVCPYCGYEWDDDDSVYVDTDVIVCCEKCGKIHNLSGEIHVEYKTSSLNARYYCKNHCNDELRCSINGELCLHDYYGCTCEYADLIQESNIELD